MILLISNLLSSFLSGEFSGNIMLYIYTSLTVIEHPSKFFFLFLCVCVCAIFHIIFFNVISSNVIAVQSYCTSIIFKYYLHIESFYFLKCTVCNNNATKYIIISRSILRTRNKRMKYFF
jgi:hypothetical protein